MRPERKGGFVNLYIVINPFYATGLFLYPLKTSENQRFSDVFRGYRKRPVAWNGLRFNITHFSLMFHFYTLKTSENQRF